MSRLAEPFLGRWRIGHMNEYDQDYLDLVETAFIRFDRDGSGEFGFGAVTGQLDCRYDKAGVTFTWLGQDEMDDVSGRGHAERKPDNTLAGHLYPISATIPDLQPTRSDYFRNLLGFSCGSPALCASRGSIGRLSDGRPPGGVIARGE